MVRDPSGALVGLAALREVVHGNSPHRWRLRGKWDGVVCGRSPPSPSLSSIAIAHVFRTCFMYGGCLKGTIKFLVIPEGGRHYSGNTAEVLVKNSLLKNFRG